MLSDGADMINRDPNALNSHVKVLFDEVIGEPEGAHSAECVWRWSYKCFTCTKNACYMCCTFLCSIPLAFCWGCEFACLSFCHIWCITPCLKLCQINIRFMQKLWGYHVACLCNPCCEAFALCFSRVNVTNQ